MKQIRVRFAPSPTGKLHLGSARTALFNHIFAKSGNKGDFILRIEDTDTERATLESENAILDGLRGLGIFWDEGPDIDGDFGPYRQSERHNIYQQAISKLIEIGRLYPCYCSEAELQADREKLIAAHKPPRYMARCSQLIESERKKLEAKGRKPTMRFRIGSELIKFKDLVFGEITFSGKEIGDFIVARSNGSVGYLLATAVDDMEMCITHVIRGEDHLSNTPRQIMIIKALGGEVPQFAHLPVVLGVDGKKLSKRLGSSDILSLIDAGYSPNAINTSMASLGWSKAPKEMAMSLDELANLFDISSVTRSPAKSDPDRLNYINHAAMATVSKETLLATFKEPLKKAGFDFSKFCDEDLLSILDSMRETMGDPGKTVEQMLQFGSRLDCTEDDKVCLTNKGSLSVILELRQALLEVQALDKTNFTNMIKSISQKTKQKGKNLYNPIRLAVTGRQSGPKLENLITAIGPVETIQRIELTLQEIGHSS